MRIIGGKLKGIRLNPPMNLPSRPTTDRSKEALFNILNNQLDFDGLIALDLFSGTGNIAIELASRGAASVLGNRYQLQMLLIYQRSRQKTSIRGDYGN